MMRKTLVLASLSILVPLAEAQTRNTYGVAINDAATSAHVEAKLLLPTKSLAMFGVDPIEGMPNGQADFVENIVVRNAKGEALVVKNLGEGDYEVSEPGEVTVSYDVRLEHDRHEWPAGVEEISYHTDQGLMVTGFALFLAPGDTTTTPITVAFTLPKGWRAMTPWTRGAAENTFDVGSRRELLSNALFLGTAKETTISAGGVDLRLVLGRCCEASLPLFEKLLRPQLESYLRLFGDKPRTTRYLIIVNAGDTGDGGAFSASFSQFMKGTPDEGNRVIWGHVMAHELLHFWNGLSLIPTDSKEEWFKEGVTDYLTIVTTSRNGVIDATQLRNRLENLNRRYIIARVVQRLGMSTRDSAEKKQENRLLVYAGGSLAGLALDVELRKATNDQKGLDDLMRSLFAEFGKTGTYSLADLERHAARLGGRDIHDFFDRAVGRPGMFDITPYLADLGLRLDQFYEEQFISANPNATPAQKARFRAIFGRNL